MGWKISRNPSDSFAGYLNEAKSFTTASGGTSLGTSVTAASVIPIPNKTTHVTLYPRNFAGGANVLRFALNPFLMILKTANALTTTTDYSVVGQNFPTDATGVSLNAFDTFANNNALYIGSHVPIRGVAVTNGSANSNASVLTVNYWNGAWTAVSALSDGTSSGGDTQAQTGLVTWTVPADWKAIQLSDTEPALAAISGYGVQVGGSQPVIPVAPIQKATLIQKYNDQPYYWTQWIVSATLSASVNNTLMLALNRVTTYAETEAKVFTQFRTLKQPGGVACIEAILDAGTGNLIGTAYTDDRLGSF